MKVYCKKMLLLVITAMVSGCATFPVDINDGIYDINYRIIYIDDHQERMEILKQQFPEIYKLFCEGRISLDEMYKLQKKNGKEKVKLQYHYIENSPTIVINNHN